MPSGMIPITPATIAFTGSGSETASINANGGVDFSACTTVSLNNVFTSTYDNYMVTIRYEHASGAPASRMRLRGSGADATGSNYNKQYWAIDGVATGGALRQTAQAEWNHIGNPAAPTSTSGNAVYLYGPALARTTAVRSVCVSAYLGAYYLDAAGTHDLSTAYDGFTFYLATATMSGNMRVFAFEE